MRAQPELFDSPAVGWVGGFNKIMGGVMLSQQIRQSVPCTAQDATLSQSVKTCYDNDARTNNTDLGLPGLFELGRTEASPEGSNLLTQYWPEIDGYLLLVSE